LGADNQGKKSADFPSEVLSLGLSYKTFDGCNKTTLQVWQAI